MALHGILRLKDVTIKNKYMKQVALKITLGYVRHLLTGIGGAMVAQGQMTNSQETQIIGGVLALIGLAWSHFTKTQLPDDTTPNGQA